MEQKKNKFGLAWQELSMVLKEIFYVFTGALIIFAVLEIIHAGIILAYININIVLLLWLVIGIIILLITKEKDAGKT